MTRIGILLVALLCTACGRSHENWPEHGWGGMAETRWPPQTAPNPPSGLLERLVCTLGRLEALHAEVDRTGLSSGEIGLLDVTAIRAKREYAGQLYHDSAATIAALDNGIDHVRHDMTTLPPIPGDCA